MKFSTVTLPFGGRIVMLKSLKKYAKVFRLRIETSAHRLVNPNSSAVSDHLALTAVSSTNTVLLPRATQSVGRDPGYAGVFEAHPTSGMM